jgi:hypothetical protein
MEVDFAACDQKRPFIQSEEKLTEQIDARTT